MLIAAAGIAASPIIWNTVAQNELRNHTLERLAGDKYKGCYWLAAWIFGSSLFRDYLFERAVQANARLTLLDPEGPREGLSLLYFLSYTIFAFGMTLVLTSMYRLGITGTYLGDYFGILMKERVTSFPFSFFENPMYLGSTLSFFSIALYSNSLVGVFLTAWVYSVYHVSTTYFEGPYTTMIYERANRARQRSNK